MAARGAVNGECSLCHVSTQAIISREPEDVQTVSSVRIPWNAIYFVPEIIRSRHDNSETVFRPGLSPSEISSSHSGQGQKVSNRKFSEQRHFEFPH